MMDPDETAAAAAARPQKLTPAERAKEKMYYLPLVAALQASEGRPKWVRVVVTRAHDTFALPLLYQLAVGGVFGLEQPIELRLVAKKERQGMLRGRIHQMTMCAPVPLRAVVMLTDIKVAFKKADAIFFVPYRERMCDEMLTMRKRNYVLFRDYGVALKKYAPPKAHVVILGPHTCVYATICALFSEHVVSERYITAVSRMQEARARGMAVPKIQMAAPTAAGSIHSVVVWGHPPKDCLPDLSFAMAPEGNVSQLIGDAKWARTDLRKPISQEMWSRPLVLSGGWALAAACHMHDWWHGTREDTCVTMCVASDGSYSVPNHMVFSFPVTVTPDREWHIVQGLETDHFTESQVAAAVLKQRRHLRVALVTLLRHRGHPIPRTPRTPASIADSSSWLEIDWCCDDDDDEDLYKPWGEEGYGDEEPGEWQEVGYEGDQQWDPSYYQQPQPLNWDDDYNQHKEQPDQWRGDSGPEMEDTGYQDAGNQDYDNVPASEWDQGQNWNASQQPEPQNSQWGAGSRDHWRDDAQNVQGAEKPGSNREGYGDDGAGRENQNNQGGRENQDYQGGAQQTEDLPWINY